MDAQLDMTIIRARYRAESDDVLIRVAYLQSEQYCEEAVDVAREVLVSRGVYSNVDHRVFAEAAVLEEELEEEAAYLTAPLTTIQKALLLLVPWLMAPFVVFTNLDRHGRKTLRQAVRWSAAGVVLQLAIGCVSWWGQSAPSADELKKENPTASNAPNS